MAYRVTRTENKVAVGEWSRDLFKGDVLATKEVPDSVADHLMSHGLLVECSDKSEDNPWFDSEDPDLNGGIHNDQIHGPLRSNIKDISTP